MLNLDEAVGYIAGDRPMAAQRVGERILESAKLLGDQPEMGRPGRVEGTRELILPGLPFILMYMEKENVVFILRVIHTAMKWPDKILTKTR